MSKLHEELKSLIVTTLELEDVSPEDIDAEAPIFGETESGAGLGLDSIDALELAMTVAKKYDVPLQADDDTSRAAFASVSALASYIEEHQGSSQLRSTTEVAGGS